MTRRVVFDVRIMWSGVLGIGRCRAECCTHRDRVALVLTTTCYAIPRRPTSTRAELTRRPPTQAPEDFPYAALTRRYSPQRRPLRASVSNSDPAPTHHPGT
jgi:hypothetical protein